jgi:hypothetical protein
LANTAAVLPGDAIDPLLIVPEPAFVKLQLHVAVVIAPDGGCHATAGVAMTVRVLEPAIVVAVLTSSDTGKPHS